MEPSKSPPPAQQPIIVYRNKSLANAPYLTKYLRRSPDGLSHICCQTHVKTAICAPHPDSRLSQATQNTLVQSLFIHHQFHSVKRRFTLDSFIRIDLASFQFGNTALGHGPPISINEEEYHAFLSVHPAVPFGGFDNVSANRLFAQNATATVNGTITDPSGAVIEGAAVTLANQDTGITRHATTNASGYFIFLDITPGPYVLSISKSGFRTVQLPGLSLLVNQTLTSNQTLSIGAGDRDRQSLRRTGRSHAAELLLRSRQRHPDQGDRAAPAQRPQLHLVAHPLAGRQSGLHRAGFRYQHHGRRHQRDPRHRILQSVLLRSAEPRNSLLHGRDHQYRPARRHLRLPTDHRHDGGVQGSVTHRQRRVWCRHRRCRQHALQIRHKQIPRLRLGVRPQQHLRRPQ